MNDPFFIVTALLVLPFDVASPRTERKCKVSRECEHTYKHTTKTVAISHFNRNRSVCVALSALQKTFHFIFSRSVVAIRNVPVFYAVSTFSSSMFSS
jgi:hypothetical protein